MTDAIERLAQELTNYEDALWRLQNDALVLTMESPDSKTIGAVVAGLGEIAEIAETAESKRLANEARHLADSLVAGADAAVFQRVFDLVEALAALARGEGSEALQQFLGTLDEDEQVPKVAETPEVGAPSTSGIQDDYSGVDAEEAHFFCAEAREHLAASEGLLVDLERTGSSESIDEIFRGFHSIKGGAQYLGLEATASLAHRLETLLDKVRRDEVEAKGEVVTLLLRGVDYLVMLIDGVESGKLPEIDPEVLLRALDACMAGETVDEEALAAPKAVSEEISPEGIPAPGEAEAEDEVDLVSEPGGEESFELGELEDSKIELSESAESEEQREDRELFAAEYREHHDSARKLLSDLESLINDQEAVALVTRNLHSLKGIAGFAGLVEMELLAAGMDLLVRSLGHHGGKAPNDARRAVDASLELLELVADDFLAGREISVDVSEEVEKLRLLAEREVRVGMWTASELEGALESADPMQRFLGQLISAHEAGDEDAAIDAACSLEEAASLHGYEDLAEAAAIVAREYSSLEGSDLFQRLQALRDLMPEGIEQPVRLTDEPEPELSFETLALSIPGVGPKKLEALGAQGITDRDSALAAGLEGLSSVRGIGMAQAQALLSLCSPPLRARAEEPETGARDFEDLELEISGDDYDRELVEIYLDTNRRRLVEAEEALRAEDFDTALELLEDSSAAAGYMGYVSYVEALCEACEALGGEPKEIDRALEKVFAVAASMDRLMVELPASAGDGPETVAREEVELEHIFSEAAQGHLEEIRSDLPVFLSQMDEALLASLQHHLTCLEAASTNLDKGDVAEKAKRMRGRIEDLWLDSASLDQEQYGALVESLERLYLLCDLSPPELPEIELPDRGPAESDLAGESLDGFGDDLDLAMEHLGSGGELRAQGSTEVVPPDLDTEEVEVPSTLVSPPDDEPSTLVSPPDDEPSTQVAAPDEPALASPPAGGELPPGPGGPGSAEPPGPPPEDPGDLQRGLVEAQATVRVDTEKIDDLMNMAAELVVNRSSFMALGTELSDVIFALSESGNINKVEARNLRLVANRYEEVTTDLGRVSNQLQEGVMRIRMMPVKTLFARIPRLVRGLALSEGKQVVVSFEGEETELDKSVIEKLSDPLVHLIRNAVGHGLEDPSVRLEQGKRAEGRIKLTSRHEGNMVILEVEDDGRGIDLETVRQRLIDIEISTTAEARRLSDRDLSAAIFLPGFSTAASVGDISGRGVGLDVVKRNIEGLGGQVDVTSEPGRFCRFSIRIPLTMAIMQALLVKVAGEVFSIPVAAVIQTVRATGEEVSTVDGQEVITIRDQVVSLVRIGDVLAYEYHLETGQVRSGDRKAVTGSSRGTREQRAEEELYVVVLQGEHQELGIVVDELLGSQDIVIKSLDDELIDSEGIAGASILGDGTVTLILDVAEVQRMTVDRDRHEKQKLQDTFRRFEQFMRLDGRHGAGSPN